MTADQVTRLISAVAQLAAALVWPVVVVLVLVRFRGAIADFLGHLGEFSLKAPGVEASAKRQPREEAAVALGAATARASAEAGAESVADPRDVAAALPSPRAQRRMQGSRVLWVDDQPDNNRYERQALEAFGIRIDLSTSTDDALERIQRRSYDLIISDMGRLPDARAGYTLLDQLRSVGDQTPFIIYASSRDPKHVREAREHGAIGCTNSPQELITMVTTVLAMGQDKR